MSSIKFVVASLNAIAASKDAQRQKHLADAVAAALAAIKDSDPQLPDPELVFAPLQLAAKSGNIQLATTALDCIGKLISFSFFATPAQPPPATKDAAAEDHDTTTEGNVVAAADDDGTSEVPPTTTQPIPSPIPQPLQPPRPPLIDRAIDTICDCFHGETTAVEIQVQIVKSLLAAILNDKIVVHGAGLLKAVRQVYNVFLLSRSTNNQQVAQGTLTQMVGTVFERVKNRLQMKETRLSLRLKNNGSNATFDVAESINGTVADAEDSPMVTGGGGRGNGEDTPSESASREGKLTLKDLEHRKSFDDSALGDGPTMVTQLQPTSRAGSIRSGSGLGLQQQQHHHHQQQQQQQHASDASDETSDALDAEDEVYVRDAYLVFRSFCNIATKNLAIDQLYDLRGQAMRSKLLALHLIQSLLNNHMHVFTSSACTIRNSRSGEPTSFLQAIKYYLCLTIARNGSSSVDRVFEACAEIFWLTLKFLRSSFKKEIEVFLNEIYLARLSRRSDPISQKTYFVSVLNRLCADPRALVEIYLNYDCDHNVNDMFQTLIESLQSFATANVSVTPQQEQLHEDKSARTPAAAEWQIRTILPPPLSVSQIAPPSETEPEVPREYVLKRTALDALVESLRSLANWSSAPPRQAETAASEQRVEPEKGSLDDVRPSPDLSMHDSGPRGDTPRSSSPHDDSLDSLEKEKAKKTAFEVAIRQFNFKPKRGLKMFLEEGFIPSDSPQDIADFFLRQSRLDKAELGKFMGESAPENVAIMHAFVDAMDFTRKRFVDALRQFLQSFRLPGEAQIVDRYMLKFANRYHEQNPQAFANADTAYVLAYSVILLNTDLHSDKVRARMTKEEFVKNNRGVNDDADLPDEYLHSIYDEIARSEIVLTSEREAAAAAAGPVPAAVATGFTASLGQAFSNVGRDLRREAHMQQSEEMSLRSEQLFKTLFKNQRRNAARAGSRYITAASSKHVGPMFAVTWMSFFSAFSSQMQTAHNVEVHKLCLEGMRLATRTACLFDLSTARIAFVSALKNAANLNNPRDMTAKNVEALKTMLELGQTEGNVLRESWKDILMCISQLDRLQLISGGVDENAIPDVSKARFLPPQSPVRTDSMDSRSQSQHANNNTAKRPRAKSALVSHAFSAEVALESRSDEVVRAVDRIFTSTANLSGEAIVHFARALTEVSWDEIQVSGSNESPRTYSLQKIVEISYYNMTRVRFEWTNIWDVLGEHFNRVGCHSNTVIIFYALDSLRQLSMRFMELEELAGFKFQKDFLKPFEHVLSNSRDPSVKDMVLRCLVQMIQARGDNIRSGWRTMFGVFTVAAREQNESIVALAYENVTHIYKTKFGVVISQGAFTDLIVCLTEFSKNMRFQKKSLQALDTLKSIIPRMLKTPECPLSSQRKTGEGPADAAADRQQSQQPGSAPPNQQKQPQQQPPQQQQRTSVEEGFWFPILFAFHDVLMTGEDLEVRTAALEYFFEALLKHGADFPAEFWDILWRQQLSPIFLVLRSRPEMSNVLNHEELSVWLSTTMIQALRNMINLFTHYFDALEYMLDRFLELLALCIVQENDTISRIGSNCMQQLILRNVAKFTDEHWANIVGAFCELFEKTTAEQLFSATTTVNSASALSPSTASGIEINLVGGQGSTPTKTRSTTEEAGDEDEDEDRKDHDAENDREDAEAKSLKINGVNAEATSPKLDTVHEEEYGRDDAKTTPQPPLEEFRPSSRLQQQPVVVSAARKRFFNRIIYKCVLQLLMIETVNELFSNDSVYAQIPSAELLRLMNLLKKSFMFARRFNNNLELRMTLWRQGFMNQLPNLLKQESGSSAVYVSILFRMFADTAPDRAKSRAAVEAALLPLCRDIISGYVALDEESQHRNVLAWRPVVVDVLEGYASFPSDAFSAHIADMYPLIVELLRKELNVELRNALLILFKRVGEVRLGIEGMGPTPTRREAEQARRDSIMERATAAGAAVVAAAATATGEDGKDKKEQDSEDQEREREQEQHEEEEEATKAEELEAGDGQDAGDHMPLEEDQ